MEKRSLGRTGFAVTALGYGAMELRHLNRQEAARVLNAALDGGINYIDTSPDYGPSEDYIGEAIAHRRDEFWLASKCGCNIDAVGQPQEPRHVWSRAQLLANIENSLKRLKTDHLDVWQLHGPAPEELAGGKDGEVIETMRELRRHGKIRAIAMSFGNKRLGDPMYPAGYGFKYAPEFIAWNEFDAIQIVYGGLTRTNENRIAQANDRGIGTIVRGVVKRYQTNYDELFRKAGLAELCAADESQDDFLIRFALNHPGISTMIIGTKNLDHLAANIRAANRGKLSADVHREAVRRLDGAGIVPGE